MRNWTCLGLLWLVGTSVAQGQPAGALLPVVPAAPGYPPPMGVPPPPTMVPQAGLEHGRPPPLPLRGWFSTGYGCNTVPVLSKLGKPSAKRSFLGVEYGVFLPIELEVGSLSVGWEGRHGFISEDYTASENKPGVCGTNPTEKEKFPNAFFSLHPGATYHLNLTDARSPVRVNGSLGVAFMVRQLSYTQEAFVSRGPEAGAMLELEVKTNSRVRPVISGFFWGMQPLAGAGSATSNRVAYELDKDKQLCADREFSGSVAFRSLRFGGSAGVLLGTPGRQSLAVTLGFSMTQRSYTGIFTDTIFRLAGTDCSKTEDHKAVEYRTADSTEDETFFFLSVRGEPGGS